MKRYGVLLDPVMVEDLRDIARRRAVEMKTDLTWVDVLREAADRLLASDHKVVQGKVAEGAR